jgi:hypothetical protein
MTPREAHLWAIAYDDPGQAEHARAEVTRLAGADSISSCSTSPFSRVTPTARTRSTANPSR